MIFIALYAFSFFIAFSLMIKGKIERRDYKENKTNSWYKEWDKCVTTIERAKHPLWLYIVVVIASLIPFVNFIAAIIAMSVYWGISIEEKESLDYSTRFLCLPLDKIRKVFTIKF